MSKFLDDANAAPLTPQLLGGAMEAIAELPEEERRDVTAQMLRVIRYLDDNGKGDERAALGLAINFRMPSRGSPPTAGSRVSGIPVLWREWTGSTQTSSAPQPRCRSARLAMTPSSIPRNFTSISSRSPRPPETPSERRVAHDADVCFQTNPAFYITADVRRRGPITSQFRIENKLGCQPNFVPILLHGAAGTIRKWRKSAGFHGTPRNRKLRKKII